MINLLLAFVSVKIESWPELTPARTFIPFSFMQYLNYCTVKVFNMISLLLAFVSVNIESWPEFTSPRTLIPLKGKLKFKNNYNLLLK